MHDARRAGAFFSGLFLYCAAIGCASMLADIHLPRDIAARLGGRDSLSVVGVEALCLALLVFLGSLPWAYLSVKPARKSRRTSTPWFLSGVGLGWLGGLLYGTFYFALNPRSFESMNRLLLASDAPPLWGLLNILAVVSAAVLADKLARKFNPKMAHPGAPASTLQAPQTQPHQQAMRTTTSPA